MKFSLILCTINRVKEVQELLLSLSTQTYKNFEVIIVDQNKDKRLINILDKFKDLDIKHITSDIGLSKARNIGLKHANGDVVAFPDDDCTYPSQLLENIHTFFSHTAYDILLGKTIDKVTGKIVAGKPYFKQTKLNCFNFLGSSTTLFISLKNISLDRVLFDEDFGLGAKYNSGEEEDLVFRLLHQKYKGFYDPYINFVYHPPSDLNYQDFKRAEYRSLGLGAFVIKHVFTLCGFTYFLKYTLFQPLVKITKSCIHRDKIVCIFHYYRLIGIGKGIFFYINAKIQNIWSKS